MSLAIDVHAEPRAGKRITLSGSLDAELSQQLKSKFDESVDSTVHLLIMDLHRLEFLSSTGMHVILDINKTMNARDGGQFLLVNMQPQVRKVFDTVRALDRLNVFKSEDELHEYLETQGYTPR